VGASLSGLEIPAWAAQKISEYIKKPKNFLVFVGKPGIGKTQLSAALTEWHLDTFRCSRYWRERDLLAKLRQGIADGNGDYAIALEYCIDDDFLIVDDVGSGINPEKFTTRDLEWRTEVLFSLLDYRYNSNKPTLITSNFHKKMFETVYSERISSRLFATENTIISIFDDSAVDKRTLGM
jgi:DNA replication protein DnaC